MDTEQKQTTLAERIAPWMGQWPDQIDEAAEACIKEIREAVAKDPGLLEELGLEQVGWIDVVAGHEPDYDDWCPVYMDPPRGLPVFRVRPDA